MARNFFLAALLLTVLLAGCTSETQTDEPSEAPAAFDDVVVTDSTGAIRGVVVSESIVPIEGALVVLAGGQNRTTDADGAFVFNGLEAGDYFLTVSKLGYFTVQSSASVVAGQAEPPITKVTLLVDEASRPFAELLQWSGFFGCGFGTNGGNNPVTGGAGVNPCAADALACDFAGVCLLNTANTHTFEFGGGTIPTFAQAEMVWTGSQPLGNALSLGWHDSGTADFKGIDGESPLVLPTNRTEILEAHEEDITSLLVRVFPGSSQELTVTLQQRFDVYVTYFYGFEPREGWAFVNDGACLIPEDCQ